MLRFSFWECFDTDASQWHSRTKEAKAQQKHTPYTYKRFTSALGVQHWLFSLINSATLCPFFPQCTWQWRQRGQQAKVSAAQPAAAAGSDSLPHLSSVPQPNKCAVPPASSTASRSPKPPACLLPQPLHCQRPPEHQHPNHLHLAAGKVKHSQQGIPSQHALYLCCSVLWQMMDFQGLVILEEVELRYCHPFHRIRTRWRGRKKEKQNLVFNLKSLDEIGAALWITVHNVQYAKSAVVFLFVFQDGSGKNVVVNCLLAQFAPCIHYHCYCVTDQKSRIQLSQNISEILYVQLLCAFSHCDY